MVFYHSLKKYFLSVAEPTLRTRSPGAHRKGETLLYFSAVIYFKDEIGIAAFLVKGESEWFVNRMMSKEAWDRRRAACVLALAH